MEISKEKKADIDQKFITWTKIYFSIINFLSQIFNQNRFQNLKHLPSLGKFRLQNSFIKSHFACKSFVWKVFSIFWFLENKFLHLTKHEFFKADLYQNQSIEKKSKSLKLYILRSFSEIFKISVNSKTLIRRNFHNFLDPFLASTSKSIHITTCWGNTYTPTQTRPSSIFHSDVIRKDDDDILSFRVFSTFSFFFSSIPPPPLDRPILEE